MALKARVKSVTKDVSSTDEQGQPVIRDLSLEGRFAFVAEYFDDSAPTAVLHTESFEVPSTTTTTEATAMVVSFGQKVRDARLRVAQLQSAVGATINIP